MYVLHQITFAGFLHCFVGSDGFLQKLLREFGSLGVGLYRR